MSNGWTALKTSSPYPSGSDDPPDRLVHLEDGIGRAAVLSRQVAGDVGHRLQILVIQAGPFLRGHRARQLAHGHRPGPFGGQAGGPARTKADRADIVETAIVAGEADHDRHVLARPFVVQQARRRSRSGHPYDRRHLRRRKACGRGFFAVDGERDLGVRGFDVPVGIDHARGLLEDRLDLRGQRRPPCRIRPIDFRDQGLQRGGPGGTSATWRVAPNRVAFSASESGVTFDCALDLGPFGPCISPFTVAALGNGAHILWVRATDAAGNADTTPASRGFTVDTTFPTTTISGGPTGSTTLQTAQFGFSANEAVLRFECSLDTAAFSTCVSPISYAGLALGSHQFRVRAGDLAGNVGAPAVRAWTITAPADTTPPVLTLSGPASGTQATSASFTFSANEPATFMCSLDTAPFAACSSGVGYTGLQPGTHVFRVEGRDAAGNLATASHTWTLVAPPPPGSCAAGGTQTVVANADSWILQSSASSNYGGDSAIKVDSKSGANARVLVRFALPAIPAGCRITSATLRMYADSYKTGRTLEAIPLAAAWNESSVTWANQPAATGQAATVASGAGYREWNVTQQLDAMYAPLAGNGFLIRDSVESGDGIEQAFNSREKGTDNAPQLVVRFG